nr:unnamed protein product [Callosobruchus chinensis]
MHQSIQAQTPSDRTQKTA